MNYRTVRACSLLLVGIVAATSPGLTAVQAQESELPEPFLYDGEFAPVLPTRELEFPRLRIYNETPSIPAELMMRQGPLVFSDERQVNIAERFIGNWRLVAYDRIDADGTTRPWSIAGRLMYDADGNMAAQLMPLEDEGDESTRRYFAYFGTFDLDESAGTVTHHVEASNVRRWVGTDLVRHYRFQDDKLILEVRDGDRPTGRLTWERFDAE